MENDSIEYDSIEYDSIENPNYSIGIVTTIVVPVIFGIISVVGLLGNLLVIIIIISDKRIRGNTFALITKLAVTDLLFIITCVPFTAVIYAYPIWPFGSAWCKIYNYVIHVTAYVSSYTLILMALDRFLAVVYPMKSKSIRNFRNTLILIVLLWVSMLLFQIPVILQYDVEVYQLDGQVRTSCLNVYINKDVGFERGKIYYGCFFLFGYFLPLVAITVLYTIMLRHLPNMKRSTGPGAANKVDQERTFQEFSKFGGQQDKLLCVDTQASQATFVPQQVMQGQKQQQQQQQEQQQQQQPQDGELHNKAPIDICSEADLEKNGINNTDSIRSSLPNSQSSTPSKHIHLEIPTPSVPTAPITPSSTTPSTFACSNDRQPLAGAVPRNSGRAKANRRVIRLIVVVIVVFALCWMPWHIINLLHFWVFGGVVGSSVAHFMIKVAATCFAYMNSCVNPILYAFLSENFRQSVRRLFTRCKNPTSRL